jgi:anti-sigma28 factor (negative regulator of flagellin synthesis)
VEKSPHAKDAGASRKKAADKPTAKGDTLELSSLPDAQLEAGQAQRVQAIKERVKSGTYKVDARAVAEKMISGKSGR